MLFLRKAWGENKNKQKTPRAGAVLPVKLRLAVTAQHAGNGYPAFSSAHVQSLHFPASTSPCVRVRRVRNSGESAGSPRGLRTCREGWASVQGAGTRRPGNSPKAGLPLPVPGAARDPSLRRAGGGGLRGR